MKRQVSDIRTFLNLLAGVILIIGLGAAVLIYRTAENGTAGSLGYEQGDGTLYPIRPEDSKKYQRELELYGGKANVLADELRRWFGGLWQGKNLAFPIGCLTLITSLGLFYAAGRFPSRFESDVGSENHRDRSD